MEANKQLIYKTVGELLDSNSVRLGSMEALVFCDHSISYDWKGLNDKVNAVAKGFLALNIKRGDHIAVWATNIAEWILTQLASSKIGCPLVTINPEWKSEELAFALQQSDTCVLVMMAGFEKTSNGKTYQYNYLDTIYQLCPELAQQGTNSEIYTEKFPKLKRIINVSEDYAKGMKNWSELIKLGESVTDLELEAVTSTVRPEDIALIQYTSGTTGFPKGAMLSHYNIINDAQLVAENMHLTPEDRLCGPVPFYHCFGSILVNMTCLVTGATIVIPSDLFDAEKTLTAVVKEKCTLLHGVPTMFIAELENPALGSLNIKTLRSGIIAGAPVDMELMEDIINKLGAKEMTIAYGLTEASPVTHQTTVDDSIERRVNSIGKPIKFTQSIIVDPITMKEMKTGEVGEIWVKGFNVMEGYYNNHQETQQAIVNGWLRTGDLGYVDTGNYYHIVGRLKDMIIVGGHNVYPAEVEQGLHSLFEEEAEIIQVVGIPHPKLQEQVVMIVKCHEGQKLTLEMVKARSKNKFEWPKTPRHLILLEDFSNYMTVTGKIQKFKLKEMAFDKLLGKNSSVA